MEKNVDKSEDRHETGLYAFGRCGEWCVHIDDTLTDPPKWFVQIEGRLVHLYFELPSLRIVDTTIQFLEQRTLTATRFDENRDTLRIGTFHGIPVVLCRDDEWDRFFLRIADTEESTLSFEVTSEDATALTNALRQAREDFVKEDLIEST
jgi:hypothetical protein